MKCDEQVVPTQLASTVVRNSRNPETELNIPGVATLKNIYSDFTVTFEVYCLQAQEEVIPHEVKYHINNKKVTIRKVNDKIWRKIFSAIGKTDPEEGEARIETVETSQGIAGWTTGRTIVYLCAHGLRGFFHTGREQNSLDSE